MTYLVIITTLQALYSFNTLNLFICILNTDLLFVIKNTMFKIGVKFARPRYEHFLFGGCEKSNPYPGASYKIIFAFPVCLWSVGLMCAI